MQQARPPAAALLPIAMKGGGGKKFHRALQLCRLHWPLIGSPVLVRESSLLWRGRGGKG